MQFFALADCNNFFFFFERAFRPDLRNRPVVVLSNNDGCIIARSNESKKLGLKMGDPYFKVKDFMARNNVTVFSSNYMLYGDMSSRVMSILSKFSPSIDIYSIDECFMDLSGMQDLHDLGAYALKIVDTVKRYTGLPISVGMAPSKTLAKIAAEFAKKYPGYKGACIIDSEEKRDKALQLTPIGEVWGIGRRLRPKMEKAGFFTAAGFAAADGDKIRRMFNINVYNTWRELNGISCLDISELPHNKSICVSRSFSGSGISDKHELESSIAGFAAKAAEKLRKQKCVCSQITVFAHTSRFLSGPGTHYICQNIHFPYPTQDSGEIVSMTLAGLRSRYAKGNFNYKKGGVVLWDISSIKHTPSYLFDNKDRAKQARLNSIVDKINLVNGRHSVHLAIENYDIRAEHGHLSPQYTTKLDDIMILHC